MSDWSAFTRVHGAQSSARDLCGFMVTTGLVVFRLLWSHFYLSAFLLWRLLLVGRELFYALLRHIAGVLGQTLVEWLRKQFPWICLLSCSSSLPCSLCFSLGLNRISLASLECVSVIYTVGAAAHAHIRAVISPLLWHTHTHTHTQSLTNPPLCQRVDK